MEMIHEEVMLEEVMRLEGEHRRARIINALAECFEMLIPEDCDPEDDNMPKMPEKQLVNPARLPAVVKTVQKRFVHWSALDKQDALPALLLTYGDNGSAPDSDVVGYVDEVFPVAVTAVMKEDQIPVIVAERDDNGEIIRDENGKICYTEKREQDDENGEKGKIIYKDLIDQASDMHYSIGQLVNGSDLGVEGVNPEKTRIASWRGSEGAISKFEIIRFRVVVEHRYLATENV